MAKDSSFDVVSEVNMQEVDNAFQQTTREISQRYDLKDSGATIELSKGDKLFSINAPADFVSKQIIDVLSSKLIKRGIDLKAVSWDASQAASGGTVRVLGHIVEGIDQTTAKKINKDIKDQKLKVKVTIEADKLRVSSASKDALQAVIQFLRDQDYGQPLQFTNCTLYHAWLRQERGRYRPHAFAADRCGLRGGIRSAGCRYRHRQYVLVPCLCNVREHRDHARACQRGAGRRSFLPDRHVRLRAVTLR